MKRMLLLFWLGLSGAAIGAGPGVAAGRPPAAEDITFSPAEQDRLRLVAHRGYTPVAPENSLPAFRAAGAHQYWAIETDVRQTKDGVLICSHDATLDRMFNASGAIQDLTLAELRPARMDAGRGVLGYPESDLRLPLFREYLQICRDSGARPFIEHKAGRVADIVTAAREYFSDRDIIISSTDLAVLVEVRALSREIFIHHIFSSEKSLDELSALGNSGLAFNYTDLDAPETRAKVEGLIARAHAAGVKVCLRAGDDRATVKKMLDLGLDYIPTNVVTMDGVRGGAERAAEASASKPTYPD